MRIGSLFSGIGGLDLAVESVTGGEVVWQAEVDPYACTVLERHWPAVPNLGNVAHITDPPDVDVICGGFPCQDVSNAGTRSGIEGQRSGLWREMARLVRRVQPRLVFVENVSALTARGLGDVLGNLAELGFDAEWSCVQAAAAGAPHRRNRIFILAWRDARCLRPLADAVHDRRGSGSEARDEDWRDASWHDPHGRDAGVVFPAGPSSEVAWVEAAATEAGRPEPAVHRDAHGPPKGMDAWQRRERLRCLGNAVVPRQAVMAYAGLARRAAA